jgi:hypothetical protein
MKKTPNAGAETRRAQMPLGSVLMELRDFRRDAEPAAADGAQKPAARASVVFTTGARVMRYDWINDRRYWEELEVSAAAIDLSRLERGAPLLDTHSGWRLSDTLGVVENPKIESGRGTVEATFSRRPEVAGVVQDVEDGILRNVSVGYSRDKIDRIPPQKEGDLWVYRVTRWTPHEVSIVPMPADMDAQIQRSAGGDLVIRDEKGERPVRSFPCEFVDTPDSILPTAAARGNNAGEMKMDEEQNKAAAAAEAEQKRQLEAARAEAAKAERARIADIQKAVRTAKLGDDFARTLVDEGVTGDAIAARILSAWAERQEKEGTSRSETRASITRDERDTMRSAMEEAIVVRTNPRAKVSDAARQYRGLTLVDLAREAIEAQGGSTRGLSKDEVARAALNCDRDLQTRAGMHSTSDFPQILASTVNRVLRQQFELAPRTFTPWTRAATLPDFREIARIQLSELTSMQKVNEGGEYKYVTLGDAAERYALVKYGSVIPLTWEAMVNDDLSAFSRVPQVIANSAAALESDIVYGILSANANLADGGALFNATAVTTPGGHANLAGSGAAIAIATLQAARQAIRTQRSMAPAAGVAGRFLNLVPEFLIAGPSSELAAAQFTSPNYVPVTNATINPEYNRGLTVIIEPRIADTSWYLATNPGRMDTIEYAYLEGQEGLFTERREGFEVDGVEIKVRHVFAAKAIDFRGLYRNPGA